MLDVSRRHLIRHRIHRPLPAHVYEISGPHRGGIWTPRSRHRWRENSLDRHIYELPSDFLRGRGGRLGPDPDGPFAGTRFRAGALFAFAGGGFGSKIVG